MTSRRIAAALTTLGMAAAGGTAAMTYSGAPLPHPATAQHAAMPHNSTPGTSYNATLAMSYNGQPAMSYD